MRRNIIKKTFSKIQTLNLAAIGIMALTIMTILLAVSFSIGVESNLPLWTALVLMATGVAAIVMQLKKDNSKEP